VNTIRRNVVLTVDLDKWASEQMKSVNCATLSEFTRDVFRHTRALTEAREDMKTREEIQKILKSKPGRNLAKKIRELLNKKP